MENPDMSIFDEPASNPNNCGKRVSRRAGRSEYRAAFNWPPGSQQPTTLNHQTVNNGVSSTTPAGLLSHESGGAVHVTGDWVRDQPQVSTNANPVPVDHKHLKSLPQQSVTRGPAGLLSLESGGVAHVTGDWVSDRPQVLFAPSPPLDHEHVKPNHQQSLACGPAGLPSHEKGGVVHLSGDWVRDQPQVLFASPQVDHKYVKPTCKTEYRKKFKPFSTYVYIPGSGWKKSKQFGKESDGDGFTNGTVRATSEGALEWYEEVVERAKKACEFRSRSQFGHPIVGVDHLESIYRETSSNLWNQPKDRSIAALALATSHNLRVSARPTKGHSRDSSRDSSKAGSDRVTTSNHVNAMISPSKETRKQLDGKVKPSTDKKRSGGSTTSGGGGAKPASVDSEGGKIWLKPKKEPPPPPKSVTEGAGGGDGKKDSVGGISDEGDNEDKMKGSGSGDTPATTGASSLVTSESLTPLLSPREKDDHESESNSTKSPNNSDDQPRSPRPNSLVSSIINGSSGLSSPPSGILPEGPVKTTEIKSPEEVVGVKSPSPELWQVSIEPEADINWTEGKPTSIGTNLMGDKGISDTNSTKKQLGDDKQSESKETNVISLGTERSNQSQSIDSN